MPLQKQPVVFNFAQGVDTKSDPKQILIGKFQDLQNSIFDKTGLLQKRNGFASLTTLPVASSAYLTTWNGNLLAMNVGVTSAYSNANSSWISRGVFYGSEVSAQPLIRSTYSKVQVDYAIAANGLACVVYSEIVDATPTINYYYEVIEESTGQVIISPTILVNTSSSGFPKVFALSNRFLIIFPSGTTQLNYWSILLSNPATTTFAAIATDYSPNPAAVYYPSFDAGVASDTLFVAYSKVYGTGPTNMLTISNALVVSAPTSFAGVLFDMGCVAVDTASTPIIYVIGVNKTTNQFRLFSVNTSLTVVTAATTAIDLIPGQAIRNITAVANAGTVVILGDAGGTTATAINNRDTWRATYIVGSGFVLVDHGGGPVPQVQATWGTGLNSRAFYINGVVHWIGSYASNSDIVGTAIPYVSSQSTYFLIKINSDALFANSNLVAKLAYGNGGGNTFNNIFSVIVSGNDIKFPYMFQSILLTPGATSLAAIAYSQLGINRAEITVNNVDLSSVEIAKTRITTSGITSTYDGEFSSELGFTLFPDFVKTVDGNGTSTAVVCSGAGSVSAQDYFYIATYERTDNAGNIIRSSPSIQIPVKTASITGKNTITVPCYHQTLIVQGTSTSITNTICRIVLYRWSTAQPVFHQVTSETIPTVNSLFNASVSIVDTFSDAQIAANNILYTNGGVVENIAPPPSSAIAIYKSRVFLVDAEDRSLIWFSKQVIEATPVEMSDLFTIFVGPTAGATESPGDIVALAVLDDKLIIFKENEIFYLVGNGPDNTGANNDFSDPIHITSPVGCNNKVSIVNTPEGIMFGSDKGIWLLSRSLQVSYIGAPVERFNVYTILDALNVLETNQVRYSMSDGTTLMYDYYFGQWGTFVGIPNVSSTMYQSVHAFVNSSGQVLKETASHYYDGTTATPVLMSFKTGPLNIAGVQGFERAYWFTFIGDYISPHSLNCEIAYDYSSSFTQISSLTPDSADAIEQWQIYFRQQKLQSIQLYVQEVAVGSSPGASFNMSGLNIQIGVKANTPKLKQTVSVG